MTDIKSMTQEEITDALRAMGEPAFRGKQVFSWLHKGATDFAEMNNLCEKSSARSLPLQRRPSPASRFPGSTARSNTSGSCATATASRRCS